MYKRRHIGLTALAFVIIASIGYYWLPDRIMFWFIKTQKLAMKCSYPDGQECKKTDQCVFLNPKASICFPKPTSESPHILFPKIVTSRSICTQGPRSNQGRTHSYLNTAYAVDLSSPKSDTNAEIISAFDGLAMIHEGCNNQDDRDFNNDSCGSGFGNWVAVFDQKSDLIAFYGHLRKIFVKNKDLVHAGQTLGEEGKTGAAGHRHLHFSLHRNIWNMTPELFQKYNPALPPSIPWKTTIRDSSGKTKTVDITDLPCLDNNDLTRPSFAGG